MSTSQRMFGSLWNRDKPTGTMAKCQTTTDERCLSQTSRSFQIAGWHSVTWRLQTTERDDHL